MKKLVGLTLLAVFAAAQMGAPASAGKAQALTFFLHGQQDPGEQETVDNVANAAPFREMNIEEPTGTTPKSIGYFGVNAVAVTSPNGNCGGNPLYPLWFGKVVGTIKGTMKVTLHNVSVPGKLNIRVWRDLMGQACNESYVEPIAQTIVEVAPGQSVIEAELPVVSGKTMVGLLLQVSPAMTDPGPMAGRLLYDAVGSESSITFTCIPAKGKKSCLP